MKLGILTFVLLTALGGIARAPQGALSAEQARDTAVAAYIYFYPIVTMDVTRRLATNVAPGASMPGVGPTNEFFNFPAYPPADFKGVVRPNFDTLYSIAWLDLTKEPIVLSVPDTSGRYYLMEMLDMWTDAFASPGWRTTGTQAGNFLIAPAGWTGTVPRGMTRLEAPTPYVWIIGRTQTNGPQDYAAVHAIQAGYQLTPLSQWGKARVPVVATFDPSLDMKTPPKRQVDSMPGNKFFSYAAELLKVNPPHPTDEPIIALLRRIGIEPGSSLNFAALDPDVRQALMAAPGEAQRLMAAQVPMMATIANGWQMNVNSMGVYGNYYLKRAIMAQNALGANVPEDAVYPANLFDSTGKPLDGANRYRIHFEKGAYPPAKAFWSITVYDAEGYPTANPLNRLALSSWMPLKANADGSLDLYFEHDSPGRGREVNWLPTPSGAFNLLMRIYAPETKLLDGQWSPPPIVRQ